MDDFVLGFIAGFGLALGVVNLMWAIWGRR